MDLVITAKVNSISCEEGLCCTNSRARAGVMIRDSLDDNSRYALVSIASGGAGLVFENRPTTGGIIAPNYPDYLTVPQH